MFRDALGQNQVVKHENRAFMCVMGHVVCCDMQRYIGFVCWDLGSWMPLNTTLKQGIKYPSARAVYTVPYRANKIPARYSPRADGTTQNLFSLSY